MSYLRKSLFVESFITICLIKLVYSQDAMTFIGMAVEGFNPCPDSFISMEREIGRRPSKENYWTGHVNLNTYKDIAEARIELTLDAPAIITTDPEVARIYAKGKTFYITPYSVDKIISFEVNAPQNKTFPNIKYVKFNGMKVCNDPIKVKPTILGPSSIAVSTITEETDEP